MRAVVGGGGGSMATGRLFTLVCIRFERPGDSWDVGQVRGSPGQRRRPALEQELPVIDDPGSSWRGAEQGPPGGRGVVLGHVSSIVDGHPSDSRDVAAPRGLTSG